MPVDVEAALAVGQGAGVCVNEGLERGVVRQRLQLAELGQIAQPALSDAAGDELGEGKEAKDGKEGKPGNGKASISKFVATSTGRFYCVAASDAGAEAASRVTTHGP